MWHRLRNWFYSLRSYTALRPDLAMRRRVVRSLQRRPSLSPQEWFHTYGKSLGIAEAVVTFAHQQLEQYSGLPFGKLLPGDRLEEDLHWTQVCWFDWELSFYEDIQQTFEVFLEGDLEELLKGTLGDLLVWLTQQVPSESPQAGNLPKDLPKDSPKNLPKDLKKNLKLRSPS
ncbi:MAG: hypothetical protein SNJ57_08035 [Cyanobacteriota bacterium]